MCNCMSILYLTFSSTLIFDKCICNKLPSLFLWPIHVHLVCGMSRLTRICARTILLLSWLHHMLKFIHRSSIIDHFDICASILPHCVSTS